MPRRGSHGPGVDIPKPTISRLSTFASSSACRTEATIRAGLLSQLDRNIGGGSAQANELNWDELVERGFIVAGSPDDVAEQLSNLAEKLRVGHLVSLLHIGDMPLEKTLYNTELFATRVIPQLRGLWDGHQDHWMPAPLPRDDRATPRVVPGRRLEPGSYERPAVPATSAGGA